LLRLDASDVRQIRRQHGGTTNDVALAVITGGLRDWLVTRDEPVDGLTPRALIPVNVRARGQGAGGNQLSGYLCELPVGLADPVARLRFVRSAMDRNKAAGPTEGAGAVPILAGLLPPAVHRVCTPAAGVAAPLLFDTVVTNVPLPPVPLTLAGAPLCEVYPFAPLAAGHGIGVAVSAYRDTVHIGLQVDSDAVPDVDVLAACVAKSCATLHELCA
jgi:WS/DGAT/MGAT family acyltransferase